MHEGFKTLLLITVADTFECYATKNMDLLAAILFTIVADILIKVALDFVKKKHMPTKEVEKEG